jgi:anti-sigma regulatory factor (Ser/Thr protein kinase)
VDESVTTPDLASAVLSERTRLCIPSRPEWIPPVIEFLKQKAQLTGACHQSRAGKLVLALHEALTNAVIHGNLELASDLKEQPDDAFARALADRSGDERYSSRPVTIDIDHDADRCRWSFIDEGKGFEFSRYLYREPDTEALWLSSGRGIMLMRAFVDDLYYELGGRKVTLTLYRGSGIEKREHGRLPMQKRVQVAPIRPDGTVDWEAVQEAITQNLSSSGIGLLQSQLATTDRVILGIEVEGQTLYLPAEVRHCKPLEEGVVELGCRFLLRQDPEPPSQASLNVEEAIEALLRRPRAPARAADERRIHKREVYTERIEVLGPAGSAHLIGFARDLSKGGIAFISTTALPLEECIVCLPQGEGPPLRLQSRIVRCVSLTPGFYDVGAKFLAVATQG